MLLLYLPEGGRTSSNGQIKTSLHATAILCTWSHWYTAWHCGRLRLESHCCSPFFSAVQLFEEPSWGKSGVIYPVYLKVASTWLVMIRLRLGKRGLTNGRWRNVFLQTDRQLNRMNVKNITCNQNQVVVSHLHFEQVKTILDEGKWWEECVWTSRRGIIGHRFWIRPISVKIHWKVCFCS